jgi:hypothetical protein
MTWWGAPAGAAWPPVGSQRTGRHHPNAHERLAAIAAELNPVRDPVYVRNPTTICRSTGWWWCPRDDQAVFLAHNHMRAEARLLELIAGI